MIFTPSFPMLTRGSVQRGDGRLPGPNVGEFWSAELLPVLIATVAVPMVGGVLLWCFAGRLAEKLHGAGGVDDAARGGIADEDLVRAGTFLIGVYLVVGHFGMLLGVYSTSGAVAYDALIVVVAGLGMMLSGGALVALYRRAKYLGAGR